MKRKQYKIGLTAAAAAVVMYAALVMADLLYLVRWISHGMTDQVTVIFLLLMLIHLPFFVLAVIWFREAKISRKKETEGDPDKKADYKQFLVLFLLGIGAVYSIMTAHTMTDYVYKSGQGQVGIYDSDL